MSQENVEVVKEFTRSFEQGDRDSWREYFDPDVVWDSSATDFPFAGVYHGHQGVEQFFRDWLPTWRDLEVATREYIDAGNSVVVVFRQTGTGRSSGIRIAQDFFGVYDLKDAKVVRFRQYESREAALEAAGAFGVGDGAVHHLTERDPFSDARQFTSEARVVFDVGAYVGDMAVRLREIFPEAVVYAFEPHPDSFETLRSRSVEGIVPVHAAVAEASGEATLNLRRLPYTSSLLPTPPSALRYYPEEDREAGTIRVSLVTLDEFADGKWPAVIKLDIQGAELRALQGAEKCLAHTKAIVTEVQFVPLYEGACLYHELASFLSERHFGLYRLYNLHFGGDGQLVYGDALFIQDASRAA
jgi:FkbM family methyltransferase